MGGLRTWRALPATSGDAPIDLFQGEALVDIPRPSLQDFFVFEGGTSATAASAVRYRKVKVSCR